MSARLEEITATYLGERHRFANADGDVIIGQAWANSDINAEITIKGQADLDELKTEQTYRFYGRWTNYKNRRTGQDERQFAFQSFVIQQPHSREGVVHYLRAAGEGHGFGIGRAQKLWELYGSDAVKMLREEPVTVAERLSASGPYHRLTIENAEKIAAVLRDEAALEGCTLDLMDLLTGRGFPKSTARLATRAWGNRAANILRRNPYRLMEFTGCGFKKCDSLYLDLQLPPGRLKRQALCAWYTLARDNEGHTWFPIEVARQGIKGSIAAADLRIDDAIKLACRSRYTAQLTTDKPAGPIVADGSGQYRWLAEGKKAVNERELAAAICEAILEPSHWPDVAELRQVDGRITDHQLAELARALRGAVSIIGGGPGCGKTWCVAVLAKLLIQIYGIDGIGIGAPTGKAAVRVTEAMAAYGLPLRARTWHSMLAGLPRTGSNKFTYKVLIGDETSMVDTDLMAAVFRARAAGTHVLLVGDVNQLPPVGHGAPLRDLIAAGLPYGELSKIERASGGIVEACAAIKAGQRWRPGDNLRLIEVGEPERQIALMFRVLKEQQAAGRNVIWDCQVVVPVNKKSPLARKELNKLLQNELNPNGGLDGLPFRLGDKIVNTKNGFFPAAGGNDSPFDSLDGDELQTNDRGEIYVANGELAEVIEVAPAYTVARLSNPTRTIRIPRGKGGEERETDSDQVADDNAPATGCSWDLGYALSVHKSQGSEWPAVIVMLDDYPGAKMVCSREWIYTAISRARQQCVLIGRKSTADAMCRKIAIGKRKTFLKELVLLEQAKRELAEL